MVNFTSMSVLYAIFMLQFTCAWVLHAHFVLGIAQKMPFTLESIAGLVLFSSGFFTFTAVLTITLDMLVLLIIYTLYSLLNMVQNKFISR